MRWTISVESIREDRDKPTVVLCVIERVAGGTVPENVGANLNESKQILQRLQESKRTGAVAEFPNAWLKCKRGLRRFCLRGLKRLAVKSCGCASLTTFSSGSGSGGE